jgi:hypothetical protein
MDKFIQQNFFSGPTQFALLADPLGGDEAICVNRDGDVRYVGRYWIDGRERTCRVPQDDASSDADKGGAASPGIEKRLKGVEERLQQLLQAREDDRAVGYNFRLMLGCLAAAALIAWLGFNFYEYVWRLPEPPESLQMVPVPLEVEGEPVMLGIQLRKWVIPPTLQAEFLKQQRKKFAAELKQFEEELLEKIREETQRQRQESESADKQEPNKENADP